uniref:(northern house mosquito) hypothetical protein n=1 Tax=Culex pipiens TaxID=7175 RepID=A0A8D8FFZ0_CULPI
MLCSEEGCRGRACWRMWNCLDPPASCSRLVAQVHRWSPRPSPSNSSRFRCTVDKRVRTIRAAAAVRSRRRPTRPNRLPRQRRTCWTTICSSRCLKRSKDRASFTTAMPCCLGVSLVAAAPQPTSPTTCRASPRSTTLRPV